MRRVLHMLSNMFSYLSGGSDTFPDTEEAEDPACQEAQSQLPTHAAQLLDPPRHVQHSSSDKEICFQAASRVRLRADATLLMHN